MNLKSLNSYVDQGILDLAKSVSFSGAFFFISLFLLVGNASQAGTLKSYDDYDPNIPTSLEASTQKAVPLPGFKEFVILVGQLSKPLKSSPDNGSFWIDRANRLMDFGLYQEAVSDLKQADQHIKTPDITVTVKLAQCYFSLQDYSQALWLSRKILAKDKNSAEGHAIKALGLIEYPQRSIDQCNKAIKLNGKVGWFYLARARLNQANNRNWKQSIDDCNTALKLSPKSLAARLFRAKANIQLSNCQAAILDCNKIIGAEPMYFEAYKVRSMANKKMGNASLAAMDNYMYKTCLMRMKQVVKDNQS